MPVRSGSLKELQPHTDPQVQRTSGPNEIRGKDEPTPGIIGDSSLQSPAIILAPLRSHSAEEPRRSIAKNKADSYPKERGPGIDERSSDSHAINIDVNASRRGKKRRYDDSSNVQRPLEPKLPNPSTAIDYQNLRRNLSPSQTLASKSNYQCNFGKDLPELGLSYPETFYAKMEEKREYHKNAEKDRRDRMKEALEALSRVIPQRSATDTGGNMRRDNCTKGSSPSRISREDKAALIRAAVLYIEELQQALKDRKLKQD